jgi:hypothetical protein
MTASARFSTALRQPVRELIERLGSVDIVIGVPLYDSGSSIIHVLKTIIAGSGKPF